MRQLKIENHYSNITFPCVDQCITFPGRKLLLSVYIASRTPSSESIFRQRVANDSNYLTMDHTFRITKKIGYADEISGRFVPQGELQLTAII